MDRGNDFIKSFYKMANSLSTDSEIPNGALYFQRFFDLLVSINKNYCNDIINKIHGLLELYAFFLPTT